MGVEPTAGGLPRRGIGSGGDSALQVWSGIFSTTLVGPLVAGWISGALRRGIMGCADSRAPSSMAEKKKGIQPEPRGDELVGLEGEPSLAGRADPNESHNASGPPAEIGAFAESARGFGPGSGV